MPNYDSWKLEDGGERLGRSYVKRDTLGACTVCTFKGSATDIVKHHTATGHLVTYRGTVQAPIQRKAS